MSSKEHPQSPAKKRSGERSSSRYKHSKRRRCEESVHDKHGGVVGKLNGNSTSFQELIKQIAGISEHVSNMGHRLSSLEAAITSKHDRFVVTADGGSENNNCTTKSIRLTSCLSWSQQTQTNTILGL